MNHRVSVLLLAASLLTLAPAGCGKSNTLSRIVVTPAAPVVARGTVQQLSVLAIFSDGMTVPLWQVVTWASSDPLVAAISTSGAVTGVKVGTAVITATDVGHPDITCSVTVSVTQLDSIVVAPLSVSISAGTSTQFTATGVYSTDTPSAWSPTWPPDITTSVLWSSSATTVATVGNILGSHGLATSGSVTGTTEITAKDLATGITGTATLTVL